MNSGHKNSITGQLCKSNAYSIFNLGMIRDLTPYLSAAPAEGRERARRLLTQGVIPPPYLIDKFQTECEFIYLRDALFSPSNPFQVKCILQTPIIGSFSLSPRCGWKEEPNSSGCVIPLVFFYSSIAAITQGKNHNNWPSQG